MCLLVLKENFEIKYATEDMVVYKSFAKKRNFRLITPYRDHKWSFSGEECVPGLGVTLGVNYRFTSGSSDTCFVQVDEGLHAYTDIMHVDNYHKYLYQMIIPKGTQYVTNDCEIVATRMRFVSPPNIVYWLGSLWFKFKKLW
jgi:hypothetical protein